MANFKKTKSKSEYDLSNFDAVLNFAYCPSIALNIDHSLMINSNEFKQLSESLDDESTRYMSKAMKYFYICYSITIENTQLLHNNYFYFQLFSQIGDQQNAADPIYGFYNDEKILESIKDIDSMFYPEKYDKQIFDTFQSDLCASADQIIKLMQDWTTLKLKSFNDLYFKDKKTVENLYRLIEHNNEITKRNAAKIKPKTNKPVKKAPIKSIKKSKPSINKSKIKK